MLELQQFLWRLLHQIINGILIAQPVSAANRIVEMVIKTVVRLYHPCSTSLRSAGVAAHRVYL